MSRIRTYYVAIWMFTQLAAVITTFGQAPQALAFEAEDFKVKKNWSVVKYAEGNYMVDIIGFNHCSGERLLQLKADQNEGRAIKDISIPTAGTYRVWVRYEYPPFTDCAFKIEIEQAGKIVGSKVMGGKDTKRLAFNDMTFKAQYDPAWGSEGFAEEFVDAKSLKAGKARIILSGVERKHVAGVTANRNIDLVYMTTDLKDDWRKRYKKRNALYPVLDAFRDAMGPRWELRLKNTSNATQKYRITYIYNRIPWWGQGPKMEEPLAGGYDDGMDAAYRPGHLSFSHDDRTDEGIIQG